MGWKLATVLVRPKCEEYQHEEIMAKLGMPDGPKLANQKFGDWIYPLNGGIWIGAINNCMIINAIAANDFLEGNDQSFKDLVLNCFPNSEICFLCLHSVVDYNAFAVFTGGLLQRRICWAPDFGTIWDDGAELPIERDFYARRQLESGKDFVKYDPDHLEDGDVTREEFYEDFVFELFKNFTGVDINGREAHNLLGDVFPSSEEAKNYITKMNKPKSFWKKPGRRVRAANCGH